MFIVMVLEQETAAKVFGLSGKIPIKWKDGRLGVVPVFATKEEAEEYAGDSGASIYEIKEKRET